MIPEKELILYLLSYFVFCTYCFTIYSFCTLLDSFEKQVKKICNGYP